FSLMTRAPPTSTRFPYTTLFRSGVEPRIEPDELRYSWAVAAYLVLAALALVRPVPILRLPDWAGAALLGVGAVLVVAGGVRLLRSEEHTSELQSRENLVCRLLLE